jgi:hypothetical protein
LSRNQAQYKELSLHNENEDWRKASGVLSKKNHSLRACMLWFAKALMRLSLLASTTNGRTNGFALMATLFINCGKTAQPAGLDDALPGPSKPHRHARTNLWPKRFRFLPKRHNRHEHCICWNNNEKMHLICPAGALRTGINHMMEAARDFRVRILTEVKNLGHRPWL